MNQYNKIFKETVSNQRIKGVITSIQKDADKSIAYYTDVKSRLPDLYNKVITLIEGLEAYGVIVNSISYSSAFSPHITLSVEGNLKDVPYVDEGGKPKVHPMLTPCYLNGVLCKPGNGYVAIEV